VFDRPVFLLYDGHALIYRAFYALPNLSDPQGRVVNAVYGFLRVFLNSLHDFEPNYVAVTFDHPKPTFRHKQFKDYKAHRPEMPDDLKPQIPLIKQAMKVLNVPQFELEGYEADDLIGSLSRQLDEDPASLGASEDLLTVIVTGDKDIFQLVDHNTHVWIPGRRRVPDKEYDRQAVIEKMKVTPEQIVDLKALMGDSSDNIPGVRGIGPKTAVKLLSKFETLENLYKKVDQLAESGSKGELLKGSLLKKLIKEKETAFLSQELARIDTAVPLDINLNQCKLDAYDKEEAVEFLRKLDFKSLVQLLPCDEFETKVQEALF